MPLDAAVARLDSKSPVASALSSAQWSEMSLALRERAFFTARVESLRVVAEAQNKVREALTMADDGRMDRSRFVAEMRSVLGAPAGDSGELTDIASRKRLELIYDFNTESAREHAAWVTGQDPDLLDEYPAQELIRVEAREEPRNWQQRWAEAGGKFYDGRMIALKNDPIWAAISRFGTPWPPFDFGSGMGLDDVGRDEAEALGLLKPGDTVAPTLQDFNAKLEASVPNATPSILESFKEIFGDQVTADAEGKIAWVPDVLNKTYDDAVAGKNLGAIVNLGIATTDTIAVAQRDLGIDFTDWSMQAKTDDVRHALKAHGAPGLIPGATGETDAGQIPLTALDLRAAPLIWRCPDNMEAGKKPGLGAIAPGGFPKSIRIQSNIAGQLWLADYYVNTDKKLLGLISAWRKKP